MVYFPATFLIHSSSVHTEPIRMSFPVHACRNQLFLTFFQENEWMEMSILLCFPS